MTVINSLIKGVYLIKPEVHGDDRGEFVEFYRTSTPPLPIVQGNLSMSRERTVRGIHYSLAEHGQYKYVTCVRGAVRDWVIDLRPGSPTFGNCQTYHLNEVNRRALQLPPGVGHMVCALEDDTTLVYLQTTTYDPDAERTIWPLDRELAFDFPYGRGTLLLSRRDSSAECLKDSQVWREHHGKS